MNKLDYIISINMFTIFLRSFKSLFKNILFWIWSLLSIGVFFGMWFIGIQESFHISVFLAPGITGLSFTLALIAATTRVFNYNDLAAIFMYKGSNGEGQVGKEYYDLIAPYYLSSLLWVLLSLLALLDMVFDLNIFWIKFIAVILTAGGILSLWQLLYSHMQDVAEKAQDELDKNFDE